MPQSLLDVEKIHESEDIMQEIIMIVVLAHEKSRSVPSVLVWLFMKTEIESPDCSSATVERSKDHYAHLICLRLIKSELQC